jgi:tRNA(Ile)-lysidine synthase TilS/MesJ
MGMSWGIDSSYLLYVMKEEYGLHPLVFHVYVGWNSQIAVNNIERLIDGLGLDLYTEVINWEEIKNLQKGVPYFSYSKIAKRAIE